MKEQEKRRNDLVYRYCSFSSYRLKEIMDDEVAGSTPDTFNDPFDICLSFKHGDLMKAIFKDRLNRNLYLQFINGKKRISMPDCGSDDERFFDDDAWRFVKNVFNEIQRHYSIVSLSRSPFIQPMWAHYANNSKGFVLGYDKNEIQNEVDRCIEKFLNGSTLPLDIDPSIGKSFGFKNVEYMDDIGCGDILKEVSSKANNYLRLKGNIERCPEFYLEMFLSPNISDACFFKKRTDWAYEQEVRIILPNIYRGQNDLSKHAVLFKLKPKEIIFGIDASYEERHILFEIAKQKEIPTKEIVFSSETYSKLETSEYTEYEDFYMSKKEV